MAVERFPSGVPGLDEVLRGGFLATGTYIVQGAPGTGKTILANQICFHHVRGGGRAVYVTLLAETHARMLGHLGGMAFFDEASVGKALTYLGAYRDLEQSGLAGLLEIIRKIIREAHATLLVIDGLVSAQAASQSELAFKKFINELNTLSGYVGCTTFLLTNGADAAGAHPEHTMVDGLLELGDELVDVRAVRELVVRKFRGSSYLRGRHAFEISDQGIRVFPRLESRPLPDSPPGAISGARAATGVAELDTMLRGGLDRGSTTLLLGPYGSGKTLLGLQFLTAGAAAGEPGLYFGFFESPARLSAKAGQVGIDYGRHAASGLVDAIWQPPVELLIDALAEKLLAAVARTGVRRVYLDGLVGFKMATAHPARLSRFFAALTNELRQRQVTTVISEEAPQLFGPEMTVPITGVSALVENIIYMRQVELRSHLHRVISVLKTREAEHDMALRELHITGQGLDISNGFESAERIMTGLVQTAPDAPPARPAKAKAKAKKPRGTPPRRRR
jgi:circadian clock protein KaiC